MEASESTRMRMEDSLPNHHEDQIVFTSDTLKGGAKKPELAKVLCENSGTDVEWLRGLAATQQPEPIEGRSVSQA